MPVTRSQILLLIAVLSTMLTGPSWSRADPLTVFAAASLQTALDGISQDFTQTTGLPVVLSYGGTSALARQIDAGAPADVVIAANTDWMDWLEERGHLMSGTRVDVVGNTLVLVAHGSDRPTGTVSRDLNLEELLNGGRLAMALIEAVPAGIYGRQALTTLGLWDRAAPSVAQTDNVRAALALVAAGAAPFGIVYESDAQAERRVTLVGRFPADSHDPIAYPAARVTGSNNSADQFMDHLMSSSALDAFIAAGFQPPPRAGE